MSQEENTKERILVVEDERPIRMGVSDSLEEHGYRVLQAANGQDGLELALSDQPDLILLDVMLPKLNGFELCKELRRFGHRTPVLMLTARGRVEDRVKGLDAGADDYLVKPFSLAELHARVRAMLRRASQTEQEKQASSGFRFGDVEVDLERRLCSRAGVEVMLRDKEFRVLDLLIQNAGSPVSREKFLDEVWGYAAFPTTRTIDNHIAKLRSKLEANPAEPEFILTVPKLGYRLEIPS